ncbi:hypothetical protein E6C70_13950 [Glaciibacter flavus]|uniref:Uncharacterized protein n=1 Tax=Orlajensenia flava TaxID=2565934 RepID=A0A4S4FLV0_9MICO|nr:hypothetical protein [Glaciibacter flavus]THG31158.1 hypothetical protein E6C70_13950 [Glaciibacter flavus]
MNPFTRVSYSRPSGSSWLVSPQRLDPLGTLAAWPFTAAASVVAVGYAVVATVVQWNQVVDPAAAIGAVVVVAITWALVIAGARPAGAPMLAGTGIAAVILAFCAAILETASRLGRNELLQDDFGPLLLGLLLVTLSPYRPAASIVVAAAASAVGLSLLVWPQAASLAVQVPFAEYVVVVTVPVLALGLAGAAFGEQFARSVQLWQRTATRAVLAADLDERRGVARSVQQEQVTLLSRDALPFLLRVVAADEVSTADVDRARELSRALRGTLVEELDRSWLDDLVERQRSRRSQVPLVTDPAGRASTMGAEQRAAFTALVLGLCDHPDVDAVSVSIDTTTDDRSRVRVNASTALRGRGINRLVKQYVSVIRVLFLGVRCNWAETDLTVQFDYVGS